jgi:hypothetical protein
MEVLVVEDLVDAVAQFKFLDQLLLNLFSPTNGVYAGGGGGKWIADLLVPGGLPGGGGAGGAPGPSGEGPVKPPTANS